MRIFGPRDVAPILLWCLMCIVSREELKLAKGEQLMQPPVTQNIIDEFSSTTFTDSFSVIWGAQNIAIEDNGNIVRIKLDQNSGAGFKSQNRYAYGFLNAAIKLPAGYSAGVVTAFYTSNGDIYPDSHDELDFEFLGVVPGENHGLQTNIYINGNTAIGREERLRLWFDPTADFHNYSIWWNHHLIVFFVDNIPIRTLIKSNYSGADYPTKPTSVYATIWDGSAWATDGGKIPVDYSRGPFEAAFTNFKLQGCDGNYMNLKLAGCSSSLQSGAYQTMQTIRDTYDLTPEQLSALEWVRKNFLYYSYCTDIKRYPKPLPECITS